ncbi:hypothetical protein V8C37DRAFT_394031 [Trichoderma ceciliae]
MIANLASTLEPVSQDQLKKSCAWSVPVDAQIRGRFANDASWDDSRDTALPPIASRIFDLDSPVLPHPYGTIQWALLRMYVHTNVAFLHTVAENDSKSEEPVESRLAISDLLAGVWSLFLSPSGHGSARLRLLPRTLHRRRSVQKATRIEKYRRAQQRSRQTGFRLPLLLRPSWPLVAAMREAQGLGQESTAMEMVNRRSS